jgi:hypothetical protein
MLLLHKYFSKDRTQVAVECSCGIIVLHSLKQGWCVNCPACGAEEDLETLAKELLSNKPLEKTLEEVEKVVDARQE